MKKELLLTTGYFIDNAYLDMYIALIDSENNDDVGDLHHVIPVHYYKYCNNLTTRHTAKKLADLDSNNYVVLLSKAQHCLAHMLLSKCTILPKPHEVAVYCLLGKGISMSSIQQLLASDNFLTFNINNYFNELSDYFGTSEETAGLIDNYSRVSRYDCAVYLNKTEAAIHKKAQVLKLKKQSSAGTSFEDTGLAQHHKTMTIEQCADFLNRSYNAIIARARTLHLETNWITCRKSMLNSVKIRKYGTKEEEFGLLSNYTSIGCINCAKQLGRSESSVEHKYARLNKQN